MIGYIFDVAPEAGDDGTANEYWTLDQSNLTVPASEGVLLNDNDWRNEGLTAHLYENAEHGSVSLSSDGSFVYTPTVGFYGIDQFKYRAKDDYDWSQPATVFIAIDTMRIEYRTRDIDAVWTDMEAAGDEVWVGEAVDLRVRSLGPLDIPLTVKQWTVQGVVVADYVSDAQSAEVIPFDAEMAGQAEPTIYWVDGGFKTVSVRAQPFAKSEVTESASITVNRPVTNVTSVTDSVHIFPRPSPFGGTVWVAQFGNELDPDPAVTKVPGITFTMHPDATAIAGTYRWRQLINTDERVVGFDQLGAFARWKRVTDGHVLDTFEWYPPNPEPGPLHLPRSAKDSPFSDLGLSDGTSMEWTRDDQFQMYLMWQPDKPGAIFVPLRVTLWAWGFEAEVVDGGPAWRLVDSYHSTNPPSSDTTAFPVYSSNVTSYSDYVRE